MEYYEKYYNDIFRFAMVKTKDRARSLEITQETFMKFWSYLLRDTIIKSERPLLYRIANNLIIDHYRKKKDVLTPNLSGNEYEQHLSFDEHERAIDKLDGQQAIKLLDELPEMSREIITLRFINDFSISEIAESLGKPNTTISVYLHRGIKQLRSRINDYENKSKNSQLHKKD